MFEELNCIVLSGESYPVKCDMVVLEKIQEEFGSITDFENRLIPWEPKLGEDGKQVKAENGNPIFMGRFPDIKVVNAALHFMVNEGEEIIAERESRAPNMKGRKELARKVDLTPIDIADQLHEEFKRCLRVKNGETTQDQNQTEMTIETESK